MVYDVHDFMALPWKHESDRGAILKKKDELMTGKSESLPSPLPLNLFPYSENPTRAMHKDFLKVVKYVGKLEYVDTPDYTWIMVRRRRERKDQSIISYQSVLESIAKSGKMDISDGAVDWVGKIPAAPVTKQADDVSLTLPLQ